MLIPRSFHKTHHSHSEHKCVVVGVGMGVGVGLFLCEQDSATKAKLDALTQEIKTLQNEIEQLGEQGEVEKAEEANKKVVYVCLSVCLSVNLCVRVCTCTRTCVRAGRS